MPFEWLGVFKFVGKPVADFFVGRRAEEQSIQKDLRQADLEVRDLLDQAVEQLRLLANEHNRRNDPAVRDGRSLAGYGPAASPSEIEVQLVPDILKLRYERFTQAQRSVLKDAFRLLAIYNKQIINLELFDKSTYQDVGWDFAVGPIGCLASATYLLAKYCEMGPRLQIDEKVTAADAQNTVLKSYGISAFGIIFEEIP